MAPEPSTLVILALVGGFLALDGVAAGQFMLSSPLVGATLGGLLAGAPAEGAALGLVLEALHLSVLPVGAAEVPETGPAALAGGWAYAAGGAGSDALLAATLLVLAWEWLGGRSVYKLRQFNRRFTAEPVSAANLERRHLAAVAVDFIRGAGLTAAGVILFSAALARSGEVWGWGESPPRLAVGAAVVASLVVSFRLFGVQRAGYLVAGVGAGVLVSALA